MKPLNKNIKHIYFLPIKSDMDNEKTPIATDCQKLLDKAAEALASLDEHIIDVLEVKRPYSIEYAKQLVKVISKLSPLLGNIIEFSTVDLLNEIDWNGNGKWIRQDPGFPDALFLSDKIVPNPGIEIKAWFPFATEITARFRDSSTIFKNGNINLALIAWLPEHVIWGRPQIIDTLVVSGESVANAHNTQFNGKTIKEWTSILSTTDDNMLEQALSTII